ncbi:calcium and integrin-binding protein 1-like [Babylonia areolata]|uniref:calcium and integrin-binding protein 1-like n=1 Tax=Babylonia areolata TaxID=304850 RepID=UPI003FD62D1A
MGAAKSAQAQFTQQELDDYQALTYLSKKEILVVHQRFASLNPVAVLHDKNAKLPFDTIRDLPELTANPFQDQIMKIFSSSGDGMTFEDLLDMMSVFSDAAPKSVKVEYAFRIYDFDGDDMINSNDLKELIIRLTGEDNMLTEEQTRRLIDNILDEADLDDDEALSFAEFEHVLLKAPDFVTTFRIHL